MATTPTSICEPHDPTTAGSSRPGAGEADEAWAAGSTIPSRSERTAAEDTMHVRRKLKAVPSRRRAKNARAACADGAPEVKTAGAPPARPIPIRRVDRRVLGSLYWLALSMVEC